MIGMKIRPKCPTQFCFQFSGTCSLTSDKFLHFPLISFASRNQIRLPISAINFDSFTENKGLLFFSLLNVHFVGVNLLIFTGVTPPTPPPPRIKANSIYNLPEILDSSVVPSEEESIKEQC